MDVGKTLCGCRKNVVWMSKKRCVDVGKTLCALIVLFVPSTELQLLKSRTTLCL